MHESDMILSTSTDNQNYVREGTMCHSQCLAFAEKQIKQSDAAGKRVLEVGAVDINGSVRSAVMRYAPREYIGVDIHAGPGVDMVLSADRLRDRFGDDSFDMVICTEMLEHVRNWRDVINNIKGVIKPQGIALITTRSHGFVYHGYPYDFWRYEVEDIRWIFDDFEITAIEPDPEYPGVFLVARKPAHYIMKPLNDHKLYSIIKGNRVPDISDLDVRIEKGRSLVRKYIARVLPAWFKEGYKQKLPRI